MAPKNKREERIRKLFERIKITDIDKLFQILETHSPMTVFRNLTKIGYYSSYSHAGRYYTLKHIPHFDKNGLWHYDDVCFSRFGTLKATVQHIVSESPAGMTHCELERLLRIRAQNTLRDLVKNNSILREGMGNVFLYTSVNKETASFQISQRHVQIAGISELTQVDPHITIEVLLELLRTKDWHPRKISAHLQAKGYSITAAQVKEVINRYNLKKKTFR